MATAVAPARSSRSQTKLVFFVLFGLLTVFVTYMKNARIFDPTSEIAHHFGPVKWYLIAPARSSRSQTKLVFFVLFGLLTVFVTYMKNARIFDPTSEIAHHFGPVKWYLIAHAFFAGLAMLLGAFQFSNRLRARYLPVHRTLGYVYVVSVFLAGPFAMPVARRIDSLSLTAASAVQSFGWMATTAIALYCVRNGNITQHRRWMMRSYPFAMVFTVARLIIPIPPILRMGFTGIEMVVWTTIALAAFLPNIFLDWEAIKSRPNAKRGTA